MAVRLLWLWGCGLAVALQWEVGRRKAREGERRANTLTHTRGREDRQRRKWQEQQSSPPALTLLSVFLSVWLDYRRQSLSPPFVLQWKRECTADASCSEQCIGLMQCSCVLTHSPPPRWVYCLSLKHSHTPIHSPSLPDSLSTVFFPSLSLSLFVSTYLLSFYPHYFNSPSPLSKLSSHAVLDILFPILSTVHTHSSHFHC